MSGLAEQRDIDSLAGSYLSAVIAFEQAHQDDRPLDKETARARRLETMQAAGARDVELAGKVVSSDATNLPALPQYLKADRHQVLERRSLDLAQMPEGLVAAAELRQSRTVSAHPVRFIQVRKPEDFVDLAREIDRAESHASPNVGELRRFQRSEAARVASDPAFVDRLKGMGSQWGDLCTLLATRHREERALAAVAARDKSRSPDNPGVTDRSNQDVSADASVRDELDRLKSAQKTTELPQAAGSPVKRARTDDRMEIGDAAFSGSRSVPSDVEGFKHRLASAGDAQATISTLERRHYDAARKARDQINGDRSISHETRGDLANIGFSLEVARTVSSKRVGSEVQEIQPGEARTEQQTQTERDNKQQTAKRRRGQPPMVR